MKVTYTETTYKDNVRKTTTQELPTIKDNDRENNLINIYPQMKYQKLEGFGGAVTDSAGYVFSLLNEEQKSEMVNQYFSTENMAYNQVRIPIDSCDFSLEHYEADSDPDDTEFQKFSFARVEKYILPLLDAAEKAYGGKLDIMLSPWSPPAYMKTTGERNHGGKLKPEYRKRWAEYICRYIEEYRNRGYHVTKLTMQNEPKAVQTWDSCIYTAEEQKEFLRDYLWPSLKAHGLDDIGIYLWDHNKERVFEWAETIIDAETTSMIRGMAFHWYSGDHFEALRMIREKYPDKQLLLSEACIEYSKFSADDYLNNAQKYAHDMMGNLNEGMNTFLDWNLILNEEGGPNHVGNFCDAPYLFDRNSKELKESNILGYLWHFTHFLEPGAVRIGVSRYTDKLEVTAFEKDDKITFVILNRTDEELTAHIRLGEYCTELTVQPKSIGSGVMTE
ncbi:glycoside hydrolase family 30 protein [Blautia sp. MSJ-19]|uniref:glycoside hydrolase family 30 protein n=1 Tax=Blautia sp. MSJ-19 TaxID=2841517 RepID=UPI001C0EF381|nr:glycoside hydrolase family 30 beta sandwich domain-containing protein [Blautia sp. MSJ-19]MBU5480338.1 glucosylceramidase [Blautia sp. MSJ-19]